MSHWDCPHCGGRFRDDHECDQDPARVAEEIGSLREQVAKLEEDVARLLVDVARLVEMSLPRSR